MSLRALLFASCVACSGVFVAGCHGTSSGLVPVDSPLVPYQPPAPDELGEAEEPVVVPVSADAGDDWGDLDDDSEAAAKPKAAGKPGATAEQ